MCVCVRGGGAGISVDTRYAQHTTQNYLQAEIELKKKDNGDNHQYKTNLNNVPAIIAQFDLFNNNPYLFFCWYANKNALTS